MLQHYIFHLKTRILSASAAPELLYWVNSLLDSDAKYLMIDLKDVLFMDSSGLGALTIAYNRVQKAGGKLALCQLRGQARMLIETSGMEKLLPVYNSSSDFFREIESSPEKVNIYP